MITVRCLLIVAQQYDVLARLRSLIHCPYATAEELISVIRCHVEYSVSFVQEKLVVSFVSHEWRSGIHEKEGTVAYIDELVVSGCKSFKLESVI